MIHLRRCMLGSRGHICSLLLIAGPLRALWRWAWSHMRLFAGMIGFGRVGLSAGDRLRTPPRDLAARRCAVPTVREMNRSNAFQIVNRYMLASCGTGP